MSPSTIPVKITIEYDGSRGERVTREFTDMFAARRFWTAKDRAGRRPKITTSTKGPKT